MKMIVQLMMAMVTTWVVGDFAYSRVVEGRARSAESLVRRDETGVRVDFREVVDGDGDVGVLLVHGFGSSPALYSRMAPALGEAGFQCRAMRLPGFGEPRAAYASATVEEWERAILAALSEMGAPGRPVWLLGHSMGGALCWNIAQKRPDLVSGVVLLAPLFDISSRRSLGIPPRLLFPAVARGLVFTDMFETCFPVDFKDAGATDLDARDRFVPVAVYRQLFRVMKSARASDASIRVPVMFVVAPDDRVTDPGAAVYVFDRLSAPAREIHYATRSGHVVPLDGGWEETTAKIAGFIGAHSND